MSGPLVRLTVVDPAHAGRLDAVMALGDANRATLGYIPWGAWSGFAAKQHLFAAESPDGALLGYALFSVAKHRVRLIHLCVDRAARGQGVARHLVDEVEARHPTLRGITAKCRPDYGLDPMWQRLGFVPVNEIAGRSPDSTLTVWFRSNNVPDLFAPASDDQALVVALDHNVFLDLCVSRNREGALGSQALESDWLQDQIRLFTTAETMNEIKRIPDAAERRRQRAAAISFGQLDHSVAAQQLAAGRLRAALGSVDAADESDLRHVACAAAAGASVLVTRDDDWIKRAADAAATATGVRLLRPSDIVVHLDELQNAARYRPAALRGTDLSVQSIPTHSEQVLADLIDRPGAETRSAYGALLRSIAADPAAERQYVRTANGSVLAAWSFKHDQDTRTTEVRFFRAAVHPLAATVASLTCFGLRREAAAAGSTRITVTDKRIGPSIATILAENGYEASDTGHVCYTLAVSSVRDALGQLPVESAAAAAARAVLKDHSDTARVVRLEHTLWPAKLFDTDLPSYMVAIRPRWAHDLLGLKQGLWDPPSLLGASPELVYYRHYRANPTVPARIIWYVSAQRGEVVRKVVGCSLLRAVDVDRPERLFRRYQDYGVYTLDDLRAVGSEKVAALRFVDTELLAQALPYERLKQLAASVGCPIGTIQSPTRISSALFEIIYQEARQPWTRANG